MTRHRIFGIPFADIYPHYVTKAQKKGYTVADLHTVLEWLTGQGLAHRVASDDRVFRFSAQPDAHGGAHGHFKCVRCERVTCLPAGSGLDGAARALLPEGYVGDRVELTVLGRCADCTDQPEPVDDADPPRRALSNRIPS